MPPLRATYRLQFHGGFGLAEALALVDYLDRLGISHLYASPLTQARRGSQHGYDVTDANRLNVELGTPTQLAALARALRERGMGVLLDIVPNHMAASVQNPWWRDVLARGEYSRYAHWFDIDWQSGSAGQGGKVLLPVLGGSAAGAAHSRELKLDFDDEEGWTFQYGGQRFPLSVRSYPRVAAPVAPRLRALAGGGDRACRRMLALLHLVARAGAGADASTALNRALDAARAFGPLRSPAFAGWMHECLRFWNRSPVRLQPLFEAQHYKLANWREAARGINYRRFFAVNDLVAFREEVPEAFAARHKLLGEWLRQGMIEALRVDHVDGLADPLDYLRQLQSLFPGASGPVLVEKILARDEDIPRDWPVLGATGYEFIFALDRLLLPPRGAAAIVQLYQRFIRRAVRFPDIAYGKKRQVIRTLFPGEMTMLGERLYRLAPGASAPLAGVQAATHALTVIGAAYPVYRTYARRWSMTPAERHRVWTAVAHGAAREPHLPRAALTWCGRMLSCDPAARVPPTQRSAALAFIRRWQQYTAPIVAKGLEDSAFYVYVPLPALCEVGGDPGHIEMTPREFHQAMRRRQRRHPAALNATSTHDTKRSEDIRARLQVLAEMPDELRRRLARWARWNAPLRRQVARRPVPDRNLEYLYYHSLLGAWPLENLSGSAGEDFAQRLREYILKAAREAKVETNWERPNPPFEDALAGFVSDSLNESRAALFLHDLRGLLRRIAPAGALNGLVQVALKILLPGVPDFYQGCELWDFHLVDPDNRRPVDFALRRRLLAQLDSEEPAGAPRARFLRDLLEGWIDGRVKLWLTRHLLRLRASRATLFQQGEYVPVPVKGRQARHAFAFLRRRGRDAVLCVVPLTMAAVVGDGVPDVAGFDWEDTRLALGGAARTWVDSIGGATLPPRRALPLADLFADFPVAVLRS